MKQEQDKLKNLLNKWDIPNYDLSPPWSEDEYSLISIIWRIFKHNPGTNGKKIALDEIRKFYKP